MAIDRFQEKLDSQTLTYGEKGVITGHREWLCPRSTYKLHRPQIGDYYGKAPILEGGDPLEDESEVLCTGVSIENLGDYGEIGTVVISADYSTTNVKWGDPIGKVQYSLEFIIEYDTVDVTKEGERRRTITVRRPKGVLNLNVYRDYRQSFTTIYGVVGKINSASFYGAAPNTIMFDGASINKDGKYWIHEYRFIYYSEKWTRSNGTVVSEDWSTVHAYSTADLEAVLGLEGLVE